jgi:hypothetical protein
LLNLAWLTIFSKLISAGDATLKLWQLNKQNQELQLISEHTLEELNGFDTNQTDSMALGKQKVVFK